MHTDTPAQLRAVPLGYHGSHPGQGWVEEHWRGVYGGEGNGAHAVEHNKCAGGDVRLWGGHSVGVRSGRGRGSIRHAHES